MLLLNPVTLHPNQDQAIHHPNQNQAIHHPNQDQAILRQNLTLHLNLNTLLLILQQPPQLPLLRHQAIPFLLPNLPIHNQVLNQAIQHLPLNQATLNHRTLTVTLNMMKQKRKHLILTEIQQLLLTTLRRQRKMSLKQKSPMEVLLLLRTTLLKTVDHPTESVKLGCLCQTSGGCLKMSGARDCHVVKDSHHKLKHFRILISSAEHDC